MGFLITLTDERFRLVWQGDPAVKTADDGGDLEWIAEERAELVAGELPDVVVARAISASELLRVSQLMEEDPGVIVHCAVLGVVEVITDGKTVSDPEKVRAILTHAGNVEAIGPLCQAIIAVSREGCGALPFRSRDDRAAELPSVDGEPLRAELRELPAAEAV